MKDNNKLKSSVLNRLLNFLLFKDHNTPLKDSDDHYKLSPEIVSFTDRIAKIRGVSTRDLEDNYIMDRCIEYIKNCTAEDRIELLNEYSFSDFKKYNDAILLLKYDQLNERSQLDVLEKDYLQTKIDLVNNKILPKFVEYYLKFNFSGIFPYIPVNKETIYENNYKFLLLNFGKIENSINN